MRVVLHYTWLEFKMFTRNSAALFFTGLFPILFFVLWAGLNMGGEVDSVVRWLTPSAVAWTIMSNTIMNLGIQIPVLRDMKVLKRLKGTPMPSWVFLVARSLLMFGQVAAQSLIIFILAAVMLKPISLNWFVVALVIFGGTIIFATIGLALANLIPNSEAAPGIANAVFFPMLFLAGSFFPIEHSPAIIKYIGAVNPATYIVQILRNMYHDRGAVLTESYGWIVVLLWFGVAAYFAATRFRWEKAR